VTDAILAVGSVTNYTLYCGKNKLLEEEEKKKKLFCTIGSPK
jgi:hypothetical protein